MANRNLNRTLVGRGRRENGGIDDIATGTVRIAIPGIGPGDMKRMIDEAGIIADIARSRDPEARFHPNVRAALPHHIEPGARRILRQRVIGRDLPTRRETSHNPRRD